MNIYGYRSIYANLFNTSQDWFRGEGFMHREAAEDHASAEPPTEFFPVKDLGHVPGRAVWHAVDLIALFVRFPTLEIWNNYLWTADLDREGQRVYVGGVSNGRGFEIHRHIHITERFGVPLWS